MSYQSCRSLYTARVLGVLWTLVASPTLTHAVPAPPPGAGGTPRELEILVQGTYKPGRIEVHEGERVRLKFVRKDYGACTRELVFPKLDIRRELPTNKPVWIDLPALAPGEYTFQCGMNMIKGTLVVLPKAHR